MLFKLASMYLLLTLAGSLPCPEDEKCISCTNKNTCKLCYKTVLNADGLCEIPATVFENCIRYQTKTQCSQCEFGYFLENGECTKIPIDDCAVVESIQSSICLACFNGISASGGDCNVNDKCKVENCSICGPIGTDSCVKCESGFSLDKDNKCIEEPYKNCHKVEDFDVTSCAQCTNGFYDNETQCLENSPLLLVSWALAAVIGLHV